MPTVRRVLVYVTLAAIFSAGVWFAFGPVRATLRSTLRTCSPRPGWEPHHLERHPSPETVLPGGWRSQDSQDWFAWMNYFYGYRNVTIVESGALDGYRYSNSIGPVRQLGWKAIHIESGASNYNKLSVLRKESINIHAALCDRETSVHVTNRGHAVSNDRL